MITNDDLLKELSPTELLELSDFKGIKQINQDIINDSINDAIAFISSFIKIPSNPTPLLKDICVNLTIIELKKRNNFPKDTLNEQMQNYEKLLLKMATKKIPINVDDQKLTPKVISRAFVHSDVQIDLKGLNG